LRVVTQQLPRGMIRASSSGNRTLPLADSIMQVRGTTGVTSVRYDKPEPARHTATDVYYHSDVAAPRPSGARAYSPTARH
jgi:hypothetical protein